MNAKDKVLAVYPDAWRGLFGVYVLGHGLSDTIHIGWSWKNAATRIERRKNGS